MATNPDRPDIPEGFDPPSVDLSHATPELFAALAQAHADMETVGKDGENTDRDYRYATAEAMIRAARKAMSPHGLAAWHTFYPTQPGIRGDGQIGRQFVCATVRIDWVVSHSGGGYIRGWAEIDAIASGGRTHDKAEAAAATYGWGFVLRGLLNMDRAEEDPNSVDQRPEPRNEPTPEEREFQEADRTFQAAVGEFCKHHGWSAEQWRENWREVLKEEGVGWADAGARPTPNDLRRSAVALRATVGRELRRDADAVANELGGKPEDDGMNPPDGEAHDDSGRPA